MVYRMNDINYIKISTQNLLYNINSLKKDYSYSYYILDVSNNAFFHGMYLLKYLKQDIDYLYVSHFQDLQLIRKYDQSIPVIYGGNVSLDNIFDLIMNNAIVVIRNLKLLKQIKELNIKDSFSFLFQIDPNGIYGIDDKQDILDYLEWDHKHFNLLGIIAQITEEDYDNFQYIIRPLSNLKLVILNHEENKNRIHDSNAIKLDKSVYGINFHKKRIFQKNIQTYHQIFTLHSKIKTIKEINYNKKIQYVAIIPFGYDHGMNDIIKNVYIKNKLYSVKRITNEFTEILVDEAIKKDMDVEITSSNNPLENYFQLQTLNYFALFHFYIPVVFDDYILEKTLIY
ncbi:alanine racemase [Mycoplasma sp. CAG:776]|nr:alanine racemase [Mycoplasma sp. CAG:776]